jgi:thiamine-phosphate pyrophosphorylase
MISKELYYFISEFNESEILTIKKNVNIIFRNYISPPNEDILKKIQKACKRTGKKLFLSNNIRLALKLRLDGVYLPAFNKSLNLGINFRNTFRILGSAHNLKEIKIKENQGVDTIFLAPIFKTPKSSKYLGVNKFNLLSNLTHKKIVALGGINENNINNLKLVKCTGYAGITLFKKKYL